MDEPVDTSQGYYQLAHQYIAAVLNIAKSDQPVSVPEGVQDPFGASPELADVE
jgi:hypothetical protein